MSPRRKGILVAVAVNAAVQLAYLLGLTGTSAFWSEATFLAAIGTGLTGYVLQLRSTTHDELGAGLVRGTIWTVGIILVLGFLLVAMFSMSGFSGG